MVEQVLPGWATVMHPDLRVTYQRGIYLYAKSLMAGLQVVEPAYRLMTDARPTGREHQDVASLVRDIEVPRKLGIRAWQMLPRYLAMRHEGARVDKWTLPADIHLGDRSAFLGTAGGLANVEMIYEICRLAGSKKMVPPVDMDFMRAAGSDVIVTTAPSAVYSRRGQVRIMQTLHDLFLYDADPWDANGRKFRRKVGACVKHADMILSMSEFTTQVLLRHHPEAEPRVRLLYQPIPADDETIARSALSDVQEEVLTRFGLSPGRYILFVGAVEPRKNVANLIRAHQRSAYASKLPLVIAGGVEPSYLKAEGLVAVTAPGGRQSVPGRSELDPGAWLVGRVSELEKLVLMRKAALFAFPSLVEGFGIPVLEAQSLGCPVLASSGSTMPEVLGDSALLIDHIQDVDALAAALDEVISQPGMADDLSQRGSENSKRFSKDTFAKRLGSLLTECRALPRR